MSQSYSLPYLLSYFLRTLYGMADLFIIGQFDGVAGTTASGRRQSDNAYAHRDAGGPCNGLDRCASRAPWAPATADSAARDVGNTVTLFMGGRGGADGTAAADRSDSRGHVYARGSRRGHAHVPHDMLYRHTVHGR